MRVEVFSPEAVRVWKGRLWWKKYREAILVPSKKRPGESYWNWVDTDTWVDGRLDRKIQRSVDNWHWKQPVQIPTAIVISKK